MKLKKVIGEGEYYPPFYGAAYLRYETLQVICYPVPINLIVRVFKSIYAFLRRGGTMIRWHPREAYEQGYQDGYRKASEKK